MQDRSLAARASQGSQRHCRNWGIFLRLSFHQCVQSVIRKGPQVQTHPPGYKVQTTSLLGSLEVLAEKEGRNLSWNGRCPSSHISRILFFLQILYLLNHRLTMSGRKQRRDRRVECQRKAKLSLTHGSNEILQEIYHAKARGFQLCLGVQVHLFRKCYRGS